MDEHLSHRIAVIARQMGLDVVACSELGRNGLSDEAQLMFAARQDRCLVTRDRDDFISLTLSFFTNQWPHAGLLIVPRSIAGDDFAGLARALAAFDQDHPNGLSPYGYAFLRPVTR